MQWPCCSPPSSIVNFGTSVTLTAGHSRSYRALLSGSIRRRFLRPLLKKVATQNLNLTHGLVGSNGFVPDQLAELWYVVRHGQNVTSVDPEHLSSSQVSISDQFDDQWYPMSLDGRSAPMRFSQKIRYQCTCVCSQTARTLEMRKIPIASAVT